MLSLSELADRSEMSLGGPPEMAVAALSEVREMFSASNSIAPAGCDVQTDKTKLPTDRITNITFHHNK